MARTASVSLGCFRVCAWTGHAPVGWVLWWRHRDRTMPSPNCRPSGTRWWLPGCGHSPWRWPCPRPRWKSAIMLFFSTVLIICAGVWPCKVNTPEDAGGACCSVPLGFASLHYGTTQQAPHYPRKWPQSVQFLYVNGCSILDVHLQKLDVPIRFICRCPPKWVDWRLLKEYKKWTL